MTPRDPDRVIRAFLSEGETDLPDRAFDGVRREIHRTRQRAVIGPWREPDMTSLGRAALATAAVLAIALVWVSLGSPQKDGVGNAAAPSTAVSSPTPTATATPTPNPSPTTIPFSGALEPGRYEIPPSGHVAGASLPRLTVDVPAGWSAWGGAIIDKNYGPADADAGPALLAWQISGTFAHPCTEHVLVVPTPGPGIDPLLEALGDQPGTTAGPIRPVIVDGYTGKYVEVTVTDDVPECGRDQFWLWASPDGDRRYVQGTNEANRIYALTVDGQRFTFAARIPARTTAADRAELETMIESIEIAPTD
jgi:hypothetical protein